MQVTVKLFAHFRNGRFAVAEHDLVSGACVADVIEQLGIAAPELGVVLVDGRHAQLTHELSHGQRLSIFPLVGGG